MLAVVDWLKTPVQQGDASGLPDVSVDLGPEALYDLLPEYVNNTFWSHLCQPLYRALFDKNDPVRCLWAVPALGGDAPDLLSDEEVDSRGMLCSANDVLLSPHLAEALIKKGGGHGLNLKPEHSLALLALSKDAVQVRVCEGDGACGRLTVCAYDGCADVRPRTRSLRLYI